jgi:prepilin-type N-terminal cleavage/methylation domain-containing protein
VRKLQRLARNRGEGGFTLIEVLVSLILLALVLALLVGGLRFARATWDAAARLDQLAGSDMAETFLRARLAEAMPLYEQRTAGTVRVLFQGTGDALSFVAPAPNGPSGAGLYRYALEVAPGAGRARRVLVVKLVPYDGTQGEPDNEGASQQRELIPNVRSVAFRYFGSSEIKGQPSWHAAWTRTDAIPSLVEMTIARDASEGGPIYLLIELRLQLSGAR